MHSQASRRASHKVRVVPHDWRYSYGYDNDNHDEFNDNVQPIFPANSQPYAMRKLLPLGRFLWLLLSYSFDEWPHSVQY